MNLMKKLTLIMALLFVSLAFIGAASAAMNPGYDDQTVTPSTSLTPGQTVTAVFKINIPAGTLGDADTLSFSSPINNAKWEIKIFKGEANKNSQNPAATITGTSTANVPYKPSMFSIVYKESDVTLVVSYSGKVSEALKGQSINVVKVECSDSAIGSWLSPTQKIYNPSDVNKDISRVNSDISATEARITTYNSLGVDTSSAASQLASAKTKASAAASAGTTVTAYANIEAADKYITETERALALSGLKAANSNIDAITKVTATLTERGWNTEALYLKSEVNLLAAEQKTLATQYNAGGNPDPAAVDKLVKDSYSLLDQANKYLEDSAGLPIPAILPFVIIGVVVVGAIVAVVVLLLRRRNNRWDELG